jgi:hypothetical protein
MEFADKYALLALEINLIDTPAPVWRQLIVRTGTSMRELHHMIQAIMPWTTSHLYEFTFLKNSSAEEIRIADSELWDDDLPRENDDRLFYVEDLFKAIGDKALYTYDIGDYWVHQITLVGVHNDPFIFPVVPCIVDGEGQCPPEDCGGIHGYSDLLTMIADKTHPEYSSTMEWLSGVGWKKGKIKIEKLQGMLNNYKSSMWRQYMFR